MTEAEKKMEYVRDLSMALTLMQNTHGDPVLKVRAQTVALKMTFLPEAQQWEMDNIEALEYLEKKYP